MSHFDVVAGTDDVVYGQTGAMALAISDPDAAITNADSHEYFAENNAGGGILTVGRSSGGGRATTQRPGR